MCTLLLAWHALEGTPIAVAANRDEAVDRPSRPPRVLDEEPTIVAPVDERAGGTWIGYNEHGLVVAITNRWIDAALDGERSRGLLVRDLLEQPTAEAAARAVEGSVETTAYEGFNLLVADATDATVLWWDGSLTRRPLDPGVHAIVNVGLDGATAIPSFDRLDVTDARERRQLARSQAEAAARARDALAVREGEAAADWLDRAVAVLSDHDYGFCVHRDGFGTRSSSVLAVPEDGRPRYEFADGPPCECPYEPVQVDQS